jgi:hypothetical protein
MQATNNMKQVHITIEEHQGWLYAWRKKDGSFMGQGADIEGLFERLREDVPENKAVMFKISVDEGGDLLADRVKNLITERNASDDGAKEG